MKEIYLDHAATTRLDERVLEKMIPYFTEDYGNANSQHGFGRKAQKAVDTARDGIAKLIGAVPGEIYFTSGGTEGDNWALRGAYKAFKNKGNHIIMTKIEHAAMLTTAKELEKEGAEISYIGVDSEGFIDLDELEREIRPTTILVCCMYANNEIGTIEPIEKVVEIAKKHNVLVFTDAVQAMGALDIDVKKLGVDMMSFSAHKFNGPKGMGALYIKTGVPLARLISGGHQERTRRGGTTNVPSVVGFYEALKLTKETMAKDADYVA
ncbi:MAG: cysteine desulfurase, partial [Clostridia bacterium]|nr:cysteine desulfurase [Clostridia bacterium]